MTLQVQTITATSSSGGTATGASPQPINGYVVAIRNPGTWGTIAAGTADYTFTTPAAEGSGTVLTMSNQTEPFTAYVGGSVQGQSSGQAFLGVPCDGHLNMAVVQAAGSTAGTVYIYYDGER